MRKITCIHVRKGYLSLHLLTNLGLKFISSLQSSKKWGKAIFNHYFSSSFHLEPQEIFREQVWHVPVFYNLFPQRFKSGQRKKKWKKKWRRKWSLTIQLSQNKREMQVLFLKRKFTFFNQDFRISTNDTLKQETFQIIRNSREDK